MKAVADTYDFVVVGGGTAGCVLAARLSEDGRSRVLLLEAGSADPAPAMAAPPAWPTLLGTSVDWGDTTVVQAATGKAVSLARGRVLGGGSSINAMTFVRGHRSSYDAWPAAGAEGWGFDDLLPYFKRTESTTGLDQALRGRGGPLAVGPATPGNPVVAALLDAAGQTGHRRASDIGSGVEEGFGWSTLNVVDGRRQSAADAYLTPALSRPGLTVVTEAVVHRLDIVNGRCTGVEYRAGAGGKTVRAGCSGEVVLAAGTIGSAQLLMLSGIGPQEHLKRVGIDTVLNLPGVGANLHDHPLAYLNYRAAQAVPAGANNHGEAVGLLRTGAHLDGPDLMVLLVDIPIPLPAADVPGMGEGYAIGFSAVQPFSRGTLRLAGTDPAALPLVDPDYFGDDRDLTTMLSGLKAAREIGRAAGLEPWRGEETQPGIRLTDDADLRAYIRETTGSYMHPVGTCRIGDDPMAVVAGDLRVHGVDALRVADASVLPSIPSAPPNATVYAVAERAAAMIRGRA